MAASVRCSAHLNQHKGEGAHGVWPRGVHRQQRVLRDGRAGAAADLKAHVRALHGEACHLGNLSRPL